MSKPAGKRGPAALAAMLAAASLVAGCSINQPTAGTSTGRHSANATAVPTQAGPSITRDAPKPAAGRAGGYTAAQLPASVWIKPAYIPLYSSYHWESPAAVDKQAPNPVDFTVSKDCLAALNSADQHTVDSFPAATAFIQPTTGGAGGDNDWLAAEIVVAAPDHSSGSIQQLSAVFQDLVAQAEACGTTMPGARVSTGISTGSQFAATLTIPTSTGATLTDHEYLAKPYGYVVEFSEWVAPYAGNPPNVAWNATPDSTVLSAVESGPCTVSTYC